MYDYSWDDYHTWRVLYTTMKTEILKVLRKTDQYISGQEICNQLGVSRTAIWKVINQLKEEGYTIEAISKKGYHIIDCPDVITEQEIQSIVDTQYIGRKVKYYEEVDSTNTQAKRLAEEADTDGLLVITEVQTAGKGRRGKAWESPKGSGIWMSLILKPELEPIHASGLTLVAALAVANAIRKITKLDAYIKWPNDIVINGKKVCGILTEMSSEMDYINHIVIGIGINVNTEHFHESIKDIATSLYLEYKNKVKRSVLVCEILKQFELYYEMYLETKNLSLLIEQYNQLLVNIGKEVVVIEAQSQFQGTALGVNESGELIVQVNDTIKRIVSGEVSVRGVYGYI